LLSERYPGNDQNFSLNIFGLENLQLNLFSSMIAYTELRPGNYVNALHKGKKKKFLKITLEDICQIRDSALDVFPVPIAGEWLDKFGFAHNTTFVPF
jgi:hypothetical protein